MAETARIKISEVSTNETSLISDFQADAASVRAAPNNYFIAGFLTVFFTAFFVYLEFDALAVASFALGFIVVPVLMNSDRIVFDGEKLTRTGLVARLWNRLNRQPQSLKIADIEQIETEAVRALKRGGSVFYRYRTQVRGKDKLFAFASGGEDYRRMARSLFARVSIDALDNRSIELRDYLCEPKATLIKVRRAKLPSADVLENSVNEFQEADRSLRSVRKVTEIGDAEIEKADFLRSLGNELRLSGNLLQSLEAFRRALLLNPFDARLIFDFARCLHSYANAEHNERLQRRARAALRLAEFRAEKDGELLSRLGESYFQYGEQERARLAFQKALAVAAESFRSVRGLAEIAVREGKIAHVIHHFATAIDCADTSALKRWAQNETEYFSRLNADESYMESEIRRMNLLENVERGKKLALRIAVGGFFTILFGILIDETITNVGWACASVALLIWTGLIMTKNLLAERSPILKED